MVDRGARRRKTSRVVLKPGIAAMWMFLFAGFVAPGIWSAIEGLPHPFPWGTQSWGGWILFWLGVSVATYIASACVFRAARRRNRDKE